MIEVIESVKSIECKCGKIVHFTPDEIIKKRKKKTKWESIGFGLPGGRLFRSTWEIDAVKKEKIIEYSYIKCPSCGYVNRLYPNNVVSSTILETGKFLEDLNKPNQKIENMERLDNEKGFLEKMPVIG